MHYFYDVLYNICLQLLKKHARAQEDKIKRYSIMFNQDPMKNGLLV